MRPNDYYDENLDRDRDFTAKADPVHREIMLPDAPGVSWTVDGVGRTRTTAQQPVGARRGDQLAAGAGRRRDCWRRTSMRRQFVSRGMVWT
jgi:hypothetical protein